MLIVGKNLYFSRVITAGGKEGFGTTLYALNTDNLQLSDVDGFPQAGELLLLFSDTQKRIIIAAQTGIYTIKSDDITAAKQVLLPGDILLGNDTQLADSQKMLLLHSWKRLEHYNQRDLLAINLAGSWQPEMEFVHAPRKIILQPDKEQNNTTISWRIKNYEHYSTPESVKQVCRVFINGKRVGNDAEVFIDHEGLFSCKISLNSDGAYKVSVLATDLLGNPAVISPATNFTVDKDIVNYILGLAASFITWATMIDVVVFIIMVIVARWNQGVFDILANKQIPRKVFFYFAPFLIYIPIFRNWLFANYFDELKRRIPIPDHSYIPGEIESPDGVIKQTNAISSEIINNSGYSQFFVIGESGTGKSEMLLNILRQYCSESSFFAAMRKYKVITILIRMRETPGKTIFEMVQGTLRTYGMIFDDVKMVERLLRRGNFLLLLDGLNEVSMDNEIRDIVSYKNIKMIITSQEKLDDTLPVYKIPRAQGDFAKKLLHSFLKEKKDYQISQSLWNEIKSGYDIRLLSTLIQKELKLPDTRLGIYDVMLDNAVGGDILLRDRICSIAWELWKSKTYCFLANDQINSSQWDKLLASNILIKRSGKYEFRHQLLHGYLAANSITKQVASIGVTCTRLKEEAVWKLSTMEQDIVFNFVVEMVSTPQNIEAITLFAMEELETRNRLLIAINNIKPITAILRTGVD